MTTRHLKHRLFWASRPNQWRISVLSPFTLKIWFLPAATACGTGYITEGLGGAPPSHSRDVLERGVGAIAMLALTVLARRQPARLC